MTCFDTYECQRILRFPIRNIVITSEYEINVSPPPKKPFQTKANQSWAVYHLYHEHAWLSNRYFNKIIIDILNLIFLQVAP